MASLDKLDVKKSANSGAMLTLLHPVTGEELTDEGEGVSDSKKPRPLYLRLLGSDSDTYRNAIKRRYEKNRNKMNKRIDLDDAERKAAELLAQCTTDSYLIEKGAIVEHSFSNLVNIYLTYPWIREQAETFIGERANFLEQ